ncbi:MAG: spore cortex biosynthesis protein YabQ [Firmicutes bacterium HGW-Firmicutes-13]|nr:MAG: spore cortex biosynthesis protein YabQ [Firmicutes bacterium HGW-Firmicutes-13]
MSVESQFQILFSLAAAGLIMGIIFDFYHVLKRFWKIKPWLQFILDFLTWVIITCLTAAGLLLINWGEVRVYVFLAIGLGVLIYYLYFSYRVKKIFLWLIKKVLTLIKLLIRIYGKIGRYAVRPLFKCIRKVLRFIFSPFNKLILRFKLKLKRKTKPLYGLLHKLLNKFNYQSRIF